MARIRCHYVDCVYLRDHICGSSSIELDPDDGCLTFTRLDYEDDWLDTEFGDWEEDEFDADWLDEEDIKDEDDEF